MACMDHICGGCGDIISNNKPGPGVDVCPVCGCADFHSFYDEAPTRPDPDDSEEDDDE